MPSSESNYWDRVPARHRTRRQLLRSVLIGSAGVTAAATFGCGSRTSGGTSSAVGTSTGQKYTDPGISDTEIRIGSSTSLSGPNAIAGVPINAGLKAYFQYINEEKGGINGRKINFITYDDGYDPAKSLANVRRLVEQDQVFALAFIFGTPGTAADLPYVIPHQIPFLMPLSSIRQWDDVTKYPWMILGAAGYYMESKIVGQYIAKNNPNDKIGIMTQDGDPGPDFLAGIKDGLGSAAKNIVATETARPTDPAVDSQVEHLKASGATVFFDQSPQKQGGLAVKTAYELGWRPQIFLGGGTDDSVLTMKAAGADATNGVIDEVYRKDPTDPQWQNDPAIVEYHTVVGKYQSQANTADSSTENGYEYAKMLVEFLSRMKQPTRKGLMDGIRSLKGYTTGLELPGITLNGSDSSNFLITQVQLARFDAANSRWAQFGEVLKS